MKRSWLKIVLGVVLGITLGFSGAYAAGKGHPNVRAARNHLRAAAKRLQKSKAGAFQGHRAKALELDRQARKEIKEALAFAKANKKAKPGKTSTDLDISLD